MIAKVGLFLRSVPPGLAAALAAIATVGLWAYWPTLEAMGHKWFHDPQYSHGYLVPLFAAGLLWWRRAQAPAYRPTLCWWGIPLLAAGILARLAGTYAYFDWLDAASLLPCVAGIVVLFGGWPALRWAWPSVAFLLFMIPLPYRLETALSHPLQGIATRGSTYVMQTLGLPALAEGNTILLSRGRIGVVEACNGLAMMLVFFAFATALAIVINRPWLDRAVILLSAVPVAVIANVLRITATGVAQELGSPEAAQAIFHDFAGWLMMPVALGLLWAELWLLSRILVVRARATQPMAPPVGALAGRPGEPAPVPANGKKHKKQQQGLPILLPNRRR